MLAHILPWLWHPLGQCAGTHAEVVRCKSYNFWSGIESDVGEVTLLTALVVFLYHRNCHEHRCWRLSWHPGPDGHPVCKRHHPEHPSEGMWRNLAKRLRLRARTPGDVRFHYRR